MARVENPWLALVEKAELRMLKHDREKRRDLQQRARRFPFYVVSYIKSGTCRLHMDGRDYYARAGDVLMIPPDELHDHVKDTDEETEFLWWHFNLSLAGSIEVLQAFQFPVCFRLQEPDRFEQVFQQYLRCADSRASIADVLMKNAKAMELVALIIEGTLLHSDVRVKPSYADAFASILADILEEPAKRCDLQQIGRRYHLHPTYVSNHFKRMFGMTPVQLQKQLVLDQAKKLLAESSLSIQEVGRLSGYEDLADFSRFFKSKTGLPPLHYRNERKADE